jgi:type VI secretion system protein ImpC
MGIFFSACSCYKPRLFDEPEPTHTENLLARLPYVMALSRFPECLAMNVRDRKGSFATRQDFEQHLNRWITQYVMNEAGSSPGMKARYPLRAAKVEVREAPEGSGAFFAIAWLGPHFQLEPPTGGLQLRINRPLSTA